MKLRKNRLTLLAVLAGAAWFLNSEAKKNPELVQDVKKQWDQVKTEVGKVVQDTRTQADQVMNEVEQDIGDYTGAAFETAEELGDKAAEAASDVKAAAAEAARDLGETLEDAHREF